MRVLLRSVSAVSFFLFLSSNAYAQGANPFFVPPTYPGTGQAVTADFNHDGTSDLILADGTVLLGNGDGTFTVGTPLGLTGLNSSTPIATADFNGDGKPDLVIASTSLNTFSVLLGNGDGTFQAPIVTSTPTPVGSLLVGDLNGDGKPDVLAATGSALLSYLGKGDGTFSAGVMSGGAVSGDTLADFNGDGKLDLFTIGQGIQLGNGNGTFQALLPFPTGALTGFVVGDFDGDGKLDVAGFGGTSTSPEAQVLFGNGDGTFKPGPVQALPSGSLEGDPTAADLNNDGKTDLILAGSAAVQVFKSNGDGTFTVGQPYCTENQINEFGVASFNIVVGDFNGDGKVDVAAFNTLLLGNGDGTLQGNEAVPALMGGQVAADFNNDGHPDLALITGSSGSSETLEIWLNDGKANFTLAHTYQIPTPVQLSGVTFTGAADLNDDGNIDLVGYMESKFSWSVVVLLGNGDGSFGPPITSSGGQGFPILGFTLGDLNGDGKPDLMVDVASSTVLSVLLNNGDGTFAAPVSYFAGSPNGNVVTGDFNNDGKLDAVVPTGDGIAVLLGNGDGTFQPTTYITNTVCGLACGGLGLAAADLNGDGNEDLVAVTQGQLQGLLGKGDGTFTPLTPAETGFGGPLQTADFNGDGKVDLLGTGSAGLTLALVLGNGDGTFGSPFLLIPSGGPLIADFNGDGRPDIAVFNSSELVWLFNMAGPPAPTFQISTTSLSPATVAPGGSAGSTVTVTAVGGFNASVTLTCSGLPSGANCSFAPPSLPSGSGTSALTITTSASTPLGTYPVFVVGTSAAIGNEQVVLLTMATSAGATTVSLAPNTLTFGQQASGTTSAPQTVTLTNTGAASLTISGVAVTGTNAGDFAQTNNCGAALAVGASCQISVTFKPTGMGARSAAVSIADNATGSPQMVTLTGSGPDFSMAGGSTTSATVMPGQTANYTISVSPSGGFNQTVMLTCSGAPAQSTCSVSPGSVSLTGTSAATVTVTTTAASQLLLPVGTDAPKRINNQPVPLLLCLLAMLAIASLYISRQDPRFRWAPPATLAVLLPCVGMALTSCGGGSSGGGGGGSTGTQAGTYTITVTGSATAGSTTLTHTTRLTLVVQ